jgi:hypothetical protein
VEPVRVKLYGLMSVTRRGYLTQLAVAIVLALITLGFWWFRWRVVRGELKETPAPTLEWVIAIGDALPWIVGGLLVLLALEAWIVLRRFARKEAQRQAQRKTLAPEAPIPPGGVGEQGIMRMDTGITGGGHGSNDK